MSDAAAPPAARLHDPVAHSHALGGFVAGALRNGQTEAVIDGISALTEHYVETVLNP